MAHNIKAAVADMRESILGLSWAKKVLLEDVETSAPGQVTIVPSSVDEELRFGDKKITYTYSVKMYANAKDTDPATVQERCRDINNCLGIDRKRGGNALGTITSEWSDETNEGRNGVVMVSEPQIQTIESC